VEDVDPLSGLMMGGGGESSSSSSKKKEEEDGEDPWKKVKTKR